MRVVKVFLFFLSIIVTKNSFATNPGCLVWDTGKIYTTWYKNDYAPGNPYWGPFDYFNTSGLVYTVNYTTPYPTCTGCVNPSNQFTNAGKTCFVKLAGNSNFVQGGLGQLHSLSGSNPPTTNVPLDDYTWVLLIVMGAIGVILISRKEFSLE